MKRICGFCKEEKELDEINFAWKDKKLEKFQHHCRVCQAEYRKKHYKDNKQKYIDKARKWDEIYWVKIRNIISIYLENNPCVDCGETDLIVLEFDHIDSSTKLFSISQAVRDKRPIELILTEITKCEIRCCNCHRRRTAKQFGWHSYADIV